MAELHIVAAMRALHVVVFDDAPAERTLVTTPSDPIEEPGGQRDHQQSDDCLPHRFAPKPSDQSFFQSIFECTDVDPVALRHYHQERLKRWIADRRDLLFNLANYPSLTAIQQF
jgi:hypothetical protein